MGMTVASGAALAFAGDPAWRDFKGAALRRLAPSLRT
jgi:hypothetical protein